MTTAIVLGLLSALAYGSSDFVAGLASRHYAAAPVTAIAQLFGVLTALVAVLIFPGSGPGPAALEWGALSGIGSALGTLALYHGLSVSRMSTVATISAVLTAVIPAIVGVALGNHLSTSAVVGIVIAVPAIALVSWQPEEDGRGGERAGLLYGSLAGVGFALLFIALDRAGTHAGAWPLVPGQIVALALLGPVAYRRLAFVGSPSRRVMGLTVGAGVVSGIATLLFLAATGRGPLAIVAVLTALYPAMTVLLARIVLSERWSRLQAAGLAISAVAIILITAGS